MPKRDFFGTFLALRADRPATTFLRLFWHFGPRGPGTPCNWSLQSQGCEEDASPGAHSDAPGRSSGAGHQQHQKAENQDSQHKLNQPREPSLEVMGLQENQDSQHKLRVRQRSGEGVVRRSGCPKGCFWRVRFFSAPLGFALKTPEMF